MVAVAAVLVGIGVALTLGGVLDNRPDTGPAPAGPLPRSSADAAVAPGSSAGVDVRKYGARGDGVTDDAPAIRRALAAESSVYVPAGTYLLKTYMTPRPTFAPADFMFGLRDGQAITAAPGALFKVADGSLLQSSADWGGNVFLVDAKRDITISGLTLDMNGINNLVPAGRVVTGYGLYMSNAHHVVLRHLMMRNTPGRNYVVAQNGGDDIKVVDSEFRNGGTSIPGNTHQDDFSALYLTADDVTIDRVAITHDRQPFHFSGGIELHGSRESVTNSDIRRSWPAVYIGPDGDSHLASMRDTTVTHNNFIECGRGVVFSSEGTGTIDKVDISNNVFRMATFAAIGSEPARAIDQDMPSDGNWTYRHIINDLTIESNRIYGERTWSDAAIELSQVHSARITDNVMQDLTGAALALHSSPWGTMNVSFAYNDVRRLGGSDAPAIVLALDGSSSSPPRTGFTARDISITSNYIRLADHQANSCAVYAAWSAGQGVTGITARGNYLANFSAATCGPQGGLVKDGP
jgi:Pectate lyase superfamily protein